MPAKRAQGQQRKRKAGTQDVEEVTYLQRSLVWAVQSSGWLVRVTPKPPIKKIRTAQELLSEHYPNALQVDSLSTGVSLTLRVPRNKYAVSKIIHSARWKLHRPTAIQRH